MITGQIKMNVIIAVMVCMTAMNLVLAQTPEATNVPAEIYTYQDSAAGEQYFALSVNPAPAATAVEGRNIVILADTSASMAADYRTRELELINNFVKSLNPATDRVCLAVCDMGTTTLTEGFVVPESQEFHDAVAKLEQRLPLGSTDIESALKTVAGLPFDSGKSNSVMFIGPGTSRAKMLSPAQFDTLCQDLATKKISVNSVALGPNVDLRLLACLAAKTGGMQITDTPVAVPAGTVENVVENSLDTLAAMDSAINANVVWPEQSSVKWPDNFKPAFTSFPPLRSDRDSMIIGTYTGDGEINLTANTSSGTQSWTAKPEASADKYSYLKQLVNTAKGSSGMVPLIAKNDMQKAESAMTDHVNDVVRLAATAINNATYEDAQKLIDELSALDAGNPEIDTLKKSLADAQGAGQNAGMEMLGFDPTVGELMDSSNLLQTQDASVGAITQQLVGEVQRTINDARATLRIDPEGAIQNLKNMREEVRRNPEITAENMDQLVRNLDAAIHEAQQQGDMMTQRNAEAARRIAEAQDRKILAEQMMNQQEKMNQIGKRFESVCKEKNYDKAQEIMVDMSQEMSPLDNRMPTAVAGIQWSRSVDNYVKQSHLRSQRYKAVCDALYQTDKSSMPFPDEPPIAYPDAEAWKRLTAKRREKYNAMDLAQSGEKEKSIANALKEPTRMDYSETKLSDVLADLSEQHHINIGLDKAPLSEIMFNEEDADKLITASYQGISLRAALKMVLKDLGLTYVIEDEVLKVTTQEAAQQKLSTKVYPVADLVIPIRMPDMQNVFSSMGSNSTSMSNSGFGGNSSSGNQNMGGGQFNIPMEKRRAVGQAIQNEEFHAFNITDDLSKPVKRTTRTSEAKSKVKADFAVQTQSTSDGLVIVVPTGMDAKVFWKGYFASENINDSLIHNTVLYYKHCAKYNEIINVLESAMFSGKVQPWMYEALALAQLCAGRPQAEYERTLMSAIEFCEDAQTMILIGVYMQRIGSHQRALQIFREVSKCNPDMAEPYQRAMQIASVVNDREAKKWASIGILSLAWTEDQQYLYDRANDVANGVVAELNSEGKKAEAKEFQNQIDLAKQRDCIIRVSWAGNADIDIAVEEPGGTICSMKNIQTPAGGFFMGDNHAGQMGKQRKTLSETYVCPKGFNGDYRLLVKKSWGEVIGGKVKIELFTHINADDLFSTRGKKPMVGYVELKNDQAGMMFALHDGRRTAASEQLVANVKNNQISRIALAQQLAQAFDPNAMANLDNFVNADAGGVANAEYLPYYRGGAVGYQPEIITLPTGTNLMAQAVVSADRRYVRITSVPLFSYIASVQIFNYVTGEESEGATPSGTSGFNN